MKKSYQYRICGLAQYSVGPYTPKAREGTDIFQGSDVSVCLTDFEYLPRDPLQRSLAIEKWINAWNTPIRASCRDMQKHAAGIATFAPTRIFVANEKRSGEPTKNVDKNSLLISHQMRSFTVTLSRQMICEVHWNFQADGAESTSRHWFHGSS